MLRCLDLMSFEGLDNVAEQPFKAIPKQMGNEMS
jgi:hypothetical protein